MLGKKDDQVDRLNEELDVLVQVDYINVSDVGTVSRNSRSVDYVHSGSSSE